MYYEIRNWNKVKAGGYGSDQQTFDYVCGEFKPIYKINQKNGCWGVFKAMDDYRPEGHAIKYHYMMGFKTLRQAKAFAKKEFGVTYKVDDVDRR